MKEPVIVDSTCLIGLERIDRLDILPALFEPIIIPPAVEQEFGHSPTWLKVEVPANEAFTTSLKLVVDNGEAEAIALAYEKRRQLILDDRQARSAAKQLMLKVIGTVGVLVQAKRQGIIPILRPLLDALDENNFYIKDDLKTEALRWVGE